MTLPLPDYDKIKDNYCISYFGNNKEHLIQLKLLRPIMEKTFPGVKVYLSCRNEHLYLLEGEERIISKTELSDKKHLFGYVRELLCDMESHPVEEFMKESDIPYEKIQSSKTKPQGKCVLLTNGVAPVECLTGDQIKKALKHIKNEGCDVEINGNIDTADWVMGVENEDLYLAASQGKFTALIPTGFGENIFKSMFTNIEILKL